MKAWHFVRKNRRLGFGDGRIVKSGRIYRVPTDRPLELCSYGLHGSKRLLDALLFAPGPVLCRVELVGERIDYHDTSVAYARRVEWMMDATDILRRFARLCALDVIHLWEPPDVVMRYLKTGDESIRNAAAAAASAVAWEADRAAAKNAAWEATRHAAWTAATAAAWAVAWEATAKNAAWPTVRAAAEEKQNRRLTAMVMAARRKP